MGEQKIPLKGKRTMININKLQKTVSDKISFILERFKYDGERYQACLFLIESVYEVSILLNDDIRLINSSSYF